ncbi:MAG TPA: PIN domain-containing protein [Rubricoccaceae bacterium]|jgi:predicted nucleic acid-binding protein|nr:PIN domain-containing protein [Rubricoccaceae bacterium]
MPVVYRDNCALQRPLDDRDQFRVRVEADAITAVLTATEGGDVEILSSAALRAESSRLRNQSRRDFAEHVLALAARDVPVTEEVRALTLTYQGTGIKPFDALHLASAVVAAADFFCTTDDRLLRKAREVNTRATRVVTPLELAAALDL